MLLKKTLILTSLVFVLSVLLTLWVFDKLMVLGGRDSERRFFARPDTPLNGTQAPNLQLTPLRRSA
jgi:hypothetical protein